MFSVVRPVMKRFLKFIFSVLVIFLFSCQDTGTARFIVQNHSVSKIDSLYFMPDEVGSRHYLSLQPGEEQRYDLSMAGQSTDGAYGIVFKKGDKKINTVFGYFSNGAAMEKHTIVEIKDDTLLFKPSYERQEGTTESW